MTLLFMYFVMVVLVTGGDHSHTHGGPPHMNIPFSDYKYKSITEFENEFQNWIRSKIDVFSVTDIVDVILSRLGANNIIECDNPNERPTIEALKNTSVNYNLMDIITNETLRSDLFHGVLSYAVIASRESRQCCLEKQGDCLTKAIEDFDRMPLRHVYGLIEGRYNRLSIPDHFDRNKRLAYNSENFANRFMCVDERSFQNTVYIDHGDRISDDVKTNVHITALVFYILQGYNLLSKNKICPGAYLNKIYTHYGLRDNLHSSNSLASLLHDLKYESLKEHHQHDPNSYRPSVHSQSKRHGGISPSHINRNNQLFDHLPLGHFNRNHPPLHSHLHPPFSQPPGLKPEFLHYDWNYKGSESINRQCIDEHYLHRVFNGCDNPTTGPDIGYISMSLFLDMCPALLYQILFEPCRHHSHNTHYKHTTISSIRTPPDSTTEEPLSTPVTTDYFSNNTSMLNNTLPETSPPRYKGYLYGSLSVLVISLCSIVGAGFMKLSRADIKIYMMGSMLALAVGCLVADAALHLLPEIVMNEDDGDSDELFPDYLKKLCAFLASIYAFFVLELLLSTRHTHSHTIGVENEEIKTISINIRKEVDTTLETNLNLNNVSIKDRIPKTLNIRHENNTNTTSTNNGQQTDTSIQVLETGMPNNIQVPSPTDSRRLGLESRCSNTSDRISIHDAKSGVKSLAWMIIIGDGIHNFADGLAIGAAFALTFTKGISTSITVLCHELPHELGDFAVLISTGMSIKRAMFLNFVSSLTAFAGLYLGLSLGEQAEASKWIFAVGAGMFLYVALTDLVPECKEYFKTKCTITMFLGQNIGLLLGYVAMLLLAMYEDKLEIKE